MRVISMKYFGGTLSVLILLFSTAGTVIAQESEVAAQPLYTRSEIKKMAREAHTVEQYKVLADYYASQQKLYAFKKVEMMHLWRQRNEMYYRVEKWPRPIDSARNLHDYYEYKANEAAKLQAKYLRCADQLLAK
jgi:hypothetical protein